MQMKPEGNETRMKIEDKIICYNIVNKNGYDYYLAMAPTLCHVRFGKERTESKTTRLHSISDIIIGGKYLCMYDGKIGKKTSIPVEFVHAKYYQTKNFFDGIKAVQEKLCAGKLAAEDQELAYQIDFHAIRIINGLLDDLVDDQHIAKEMDNKLNLSLRNVSDNEPFIRATNGRQFETHIDHEDDDWISLKFNGGSYYYLSPKALQDDDIVYYLAVNKNRNHMVFTKSIATESNNTTFELYISQDDGLGQDNVINFIERTLNYLEIDLKQKIDESLHHKALLVPMPDVNNFDDFYNKVACAEKEMRLYEDIPICPIKLYIFNQRSKTSSIIFIKHLENDVFSMGEKFGVLVSMYDTDYYLAVGEAWVPKNDKIDEKISKNIRRGDIARLPSNEREEVLTFYAKTKNTTTRAPEISEMYKIIRERPNDETSRILELRKASDDPIQMEVQFPQFI
jgi:hypothetical protein